MMEIGGFDNSIWAERHYGIPNLTQNLGKRKAKKLANIKNNAQARDVFTWLTDLWLNTFKWNNLPDTCNERALETTLFFHGKALFFDDPSSAKMGLIHTPVNLSTGYTIYYQHIERIAYSFQYQEKLDISNSVLIKNTRQMARGVDAVQIYTDKLVDVARSIDVYVQRLKDPYIIVTDEHHREDVQVMLSKIQNNELAMVLLKGVLTNDLENIFKVLPTGASSGALKISDFWDHKHEVLNEYCTRRGIENANTDKKERQLVDEVNANNALTDLSIQTELDSRKHACDLINDMFGDRLDAPISVELRHPPVEGGNEEWDNTVSNSDN